MSWCVLDAPTVHFSGVLASPNFPPTYTNPAATNVATPTANKREDTHEAPLAIEAAVIDVSDPRPDFDP